MPSITDSLTERGIGWAALSCLEVGEAVRVCHTCADSPARAFQTLAAYLYIASLRYNTTATASVTDSSVASVIPKLRGDGYLKGDAYRKQIKPLLVAWGLVSCAAQKPNGKGRQATLYGFPMLEKLMANIDPAEQDESEIPDIPPFA